MGWSCTLTADHDIKEHDIDFLVDKLPEELQSSFPGMGPSKQTWGWSCATDIGKPQGRKIDISGAWFSVEKSKHMVEFFRKELETLGYKIRTSKIDG